ncbi:unnamed protein product, partial [Mesocestoides corti]
VPSGPGPSYKFTVVETCERIKDEFNYVQQQCHQLQTEREKLLSERVDMQRICVVYYEMANGLNLEMHRQMEIAKRLNAILTQVIPFLAQEHQSQVASAIERAKQVTMQELNSVLAAQMEDSKLSKFANGGSMGLSNDQLEIYKQIQAHQMSSTGSPATSLPGGSSSNQTGSHGSNIGNTPVSSATFPGSNPNMIPSNPSSLPAAFLNGLMSAAGGVMMPPPGSTGIPLSGGTGREIKDYSSDDKQRVAAAAAAAATSLLYPSGGRVGVGTGQPNLPTSPFLSAGPAAVAAAAASFPESFFSGSGLASTSPGVTVPSVTNIPGRTSSAGGIRHNSGHSTSGGTGSSSLLPPPPPPTPGNTSATSPQDEKRRKLNDTKMECLGRENGGWRSADDMDKSGTISNAATVTTNRRAGRQPLNLSPQLANSMGSSYPTTNSAPAVGTALNRPPQSESRSRYGGKSSLSSSGPGAYSYVVLPGGSGTRPCALASAPEATTNPSLPRRLQHLASLPHGEVVCAVTIGPSPTGRSTTSSRNASPSPAAASPSLKYESGVDVEGTVASPSARIPHFAYTGGRGCVKLWDLDVIAGSSSRDVVALASFDCLRPDSYVRSIKLFPDASGLVIGGESSALTIWDLNGPGRRKADLNFDAPACYALALSPDCKLCYSCCSDGHVAVWDIHNQSVVQQFHAHGDGASCIELASQGTRLWTGGLDNKVRCWDIRGSSSHRLHHIEFKSQVFSLGLSPICGLRGRRPSFAVAPSPAALEDTANGSSDALFYGTQWIAVGLESSEVEVVAIGSDGPPPLITAGNPPLKPSSSPQASSPQGSSSIAVQDQHFRLTHHESCVLALRFAHHADWFITTGKDHQVNAWRTPYGACLLETKEAASVLTCDISPDDKFVVTGSGDKRANLYEVIYGAGSVASSASNVSSH